MYLSLIFQVRLHTDTCVRTCTHTQKYPFAQFGVRVPQRIISDFFFGWKVQQDTVLTAIQNESRGH